MPAIRLARAVAPDALVVLVHVVDVPFEGQLRHAGVSDVEIDRYRQDARAKARESLHAFAQAAGLQVGEWLAVTPHGDPWMRIVEQEQEQDCDLVVIGKHGRNALESLILGSTTEMVIAECSGDVLISSDHDAAHEPLEA